MARAGHAGLDLKGRGEVMIAGASDLEDADGSAISFAASAAYKDHLAGATAAAIFVNDKLAGHVGPNTVALICDEPYSVFIDALNVLYPEDTRRVVAAGGQSGTYTSEESVDIGSGAVIGPGAEIGAGTVIGANAVIGAGVAIGRNCVIGAGCVVECAYLGNDVVLQSGVVIGGEGFGFQLRADRHKKIPQLGRVIIQDRVEIGANTTIDRGTLGDTVIGEGSKIDNLVQIGHNCRIGRNCVISGMCGLSGSTILEDGVVMGGGAGTAGHLTLGAGTLVLARAGVSHSFPAGSNIAGAPAQDVKSWKREIAAIRRVTKGDKK
ncbi:UDP-3-O-(3-hydroxymyristoyl)glucosamine N-acyltransferase [Pelagibacterium xiamenense]|uniref:UDP-3-O-(3-hydroxymyristoyl)glucosamine N-acyltransferase n=1 Tax=Pelagibacterium xiamenense TaxID=2901140 RepID=UPI001E38ED24|nr:UDP-3-O-(3-hydroxymyristoyl)glucosamine N-acyltransferase [Pelagibacterium xiamenense]MCD7060927.1 UDP-3-O-(3-hydroxymyristoyl)glucosamine N-acyltransferase [Pelagibacterium xiamenense]